MDIDHRLLQDVRRGALDRHVDGFAFGRRSDHAVLARQLRHESSTPRERPDDARGARLGQGSVDELTHRRETGEVGVDERLRVLASDAEGPVATLLTVFPLTAPLVLPARSALVGVPLWQHALALVLVLCAIYALVRFAGRVYSRGLLHGGSGLGLRAAWRIAREH